jgi:hypothetical protein
VIRRWLSKETIATVAMLAISFAVLGYGVHRAAVRNSVVKHTIFDLSGDAVPDGRGKWRAILVGSLDNDSALIHALEVGTARRDQQASPRLDAIVLASDEPREIRAYATRMRAKTTLASFAQNMPVAHALLNLDTAQTQFFLFDPAGQLVFRGGRPRPSDIGLLLQRYLPTTDTGRPIQVGDALSIERLIDLKTLRPTSAPRSPVLAIVFTGRCTACALENYLTSTRAVESALLRHSAGRHLSPALVFTSFFNAAKVHTRLSQLGFTMPAYQAASDLPGVDYVGEHNSVDVLVVETDESGHVIRLAPLNSFVQNLMEASPRS